MIETISKALPPRQEVIAFLKRAKSLWRHDKREYEIIPPGFGVAWRNYAWRTAVCYPFGLHLIMRVLYHSYWWLVMTRPSALERRIRRCIDEDFVLVPKEDMAAMDKTARDAELSLELLDGRCLDTDNEQALMVAALRLMAADIEDRGLDTLPTHMKYLVAAAFDTYMTHGRAVLPDFDLAIEPVSEWLR